MSIRISRLYEFGDFRLDTKEKILTNGGAPVTLTPKCFELLSLLVENHGRLLTKDELMEKLWADSFVEDSNLTFNIRQLRKVLGDNAQNPVYIKTVRQHGYRFIAPVTEIVEKKTPTVVIEEQPAPENFEAAKPEEKIPAEQIEEKSESILETPQKSSQKRLSKRYLLFAALAVLLITSLAIAFMLNKGGTFFGTDAPILQADFKSEKLTNTGGVGQAIISPDGRRMAYISAVGGKQGVWIRQFETSENVQIVPNSDEFYFGLAFSLDGESLYFVRGKGEEPKKIYRVSTLGGIPKEIVSGTQGWFSLAPDDQRISFVRCPYQETDYCSLFVANADGQNEQRLLTRPRPIRIGDNQFSPDGKSIAVALGQSRSGSQEFGLVEVDAETGAEREITKHKFFNIKYLHWLPDKSGLLLTAFERFYRPTRIFHVATGTGELRALTNDSNNYDRISLDRTFTKMVATQTVPDYHLWIAPTENPSAARRICPAQGGSSFTPGGKIVYSSITDGIHNIWTINADGTNQRQLTSNQDANWEPLVSSDERFIYFTSNRSGSKQVWRMNSDGSNQTQISEGEGGTAIFVAPDGNTVYYEAAISGSLNKITVGGDGKPVASVISKERMPLAAFDPTGETIGHFSRANENYNLVLTSAADGKPLKSFPLAEEISQPLKLVWASDGKSLFYLTANNLETTIWKINAETGKSEKFTDIIGEEEIANFTFSPDGKSFAYIRGRWHHDAVLIEGLK